MDTPLTDTEELIALEAARVALTDSRTYERVAYQMDISDAELARIRDKLTDFLEGEA